MGRVGAAKTLKMSDIGYILPKKAEQGDAKPSPVPIGRADSPKGLLACPERSTFALKTQIKPRPL